MSQVNNILGQDTINSKNKKVKVKKIIRRKKVKTTIKSGKNPLKPGWDYDNKVDAQEEDDYNMRGNRSKAKHIDLSSNSQPSMNVKIIKNKQR